MDTSDERIVVRNKWLHVNSVDTDDNGSYSCEAKNDAGTAETNQKFDLVVEGKNILTFNIYYSLCSFKIYTLQSFRLNIVPCAKNLTIQIQTQTHYSWGLVTYTLVLVLRVQSTLKLSEPDAFRNEFQN